MQSLSRSRPVIEVQAVRISLLLPLFGILLVPAAGCKTSDRYGRSSLTKSGGGSNGGVFTGAQPAGDSAASTTGDAASLASGGATSRRSGVLAGSILDGDARLRPNARIQIIDLDAPNPGIAPLSATSNAQGYFDITGLEAGRMYKLVARVQEGRRVLIGTARVVPPNPRVPIYLTDELPAGENTGVPASTGVPVPTTPSVPAGPAATIGTPLRNPAEGVTTPLAGTGMGDSLPPAVSTTDPNLIAQDKEKKVRDGFEQDAPKVNIPGPGKDDTREKPATPPGTTVPVPPTTLGDPPGVLSGATAPAEGAAAEAAAITAPDTPTVVPSCVRIGNRVDNFALYDTEGKVFELKKLRKKGRVILVDFWFTDCPPCRNAVGHLNSLQAKYGKYGLDIVGVTYEQGKTLEQKKQSLAAGLSRYKLNPRYPLILGGGGSGACPVAERLEVYRFPTLLLLDETGKIVWRGEGVDDEKANKLAWIIYHQLTEQRRLASR